MPLASRVRVRNQLQFFHCRHFCSFCTVLPLTTAPGQRHTRATDRMVFLMVQIPAEDTSGVIVPHVPSGSVHPQGLTAGPGPPLPGHLFLLIAVSCRGPQLRTNPRERASRQECTPELPWARGHGVVSETFYHIKSGLPTHLTWTQLGGLPQRLFPKQRSCFELPPTHTSSRTFKHCSFVD